MTILPFDGPILAPGVYDIPVADYHADVCPAPSLSSSGIRTLLKETPAHFAARHPRLTRWPEYARPSTKAQDLGSAVHSLVLGKGHDIRMIDLADFRNKDGSVAQTWGNAEAKRAKAQAEADGAIVMSRGEYQQAEDIAGHAVERLKERFGTWPIGRSEIAMFWQRQTDHGPIWCRALDDHWSHRACTIIDLKTTAKGISDYALQKKAEEDGAIQAAWYLSGAEALHPEIRGLLNFWFVFVEVEPPFSVRRIRLSQQWLDMAAQRIDNAVAKFADCLARNDWPSYDPASEVIDMPLRVEQAWTWELEAANVG